MSSKLKKFNEFVDTLFPSEINYIIENSNFQDAELKGILNRIKKKLEPNGAKVQFDDRIDPRKYSKLKLKILEKLKKINVDHFYEWISSINFSIRTDGISPQDQSRILVEIKNFSPQWYHAQSFYNAIKAYRHYLLMRNRAKDYEVIVAFLEEHKEAIKRNDQKQNRLDQIIEKLTIKSCIEDLKEEDLNILKSTIEDEGVSRQTIYSAWLAYNMYFLHYQLVEKLIEPMQLIEESIFEGNFYSRRILANFYANKLIIYNRLEKNNEAAYYGSLSIKPQTQDYLYYVNNYCSILLTQERFVECSAIIRKSFSWFSESRNKSRKTIFISNYCRALNNLGQEQKAVRLALQFSIEMKDQLFQHQWNYFYRTYFEALYKTGSYRNIIEISRRKKLVEREQNLNHTPFIECYLLACNYLELKISKESYLEGFSQIVSAEENQKDLSFMKWVSRFPLKHQIRTQ